MYFVSIFKSKCFLLDDIVDKVFRMNPSERSSVEVNEIITILKIENNVSFLEFTKSIRR